MKITKLIFICCLLMFSKPIFAQNGKKDTLFYFVNIRAKNIIVTIGSSGRAKVFTIKCHCLSNGEDPWFAYIIASGEIISKERFEKLSTITLEKLTNLAKNNTANTIPSLPVLVFIEKQGDVYTMHRVVMYEPEGTY